MMSNSARPKRGLLTSMALRRESRKTYDDAPCRKKMSTSKKVEDRVSLPNRS